MQLSRKRTMVATHLSSSSSNHHQPLRRRRRLGQTMKSPDRKLREEHLHHLRLLQHSHAYFSPSDEADPGDNSTTVPLLWRQETAPQLPVSRSTDKSWSVSSSLLECCPTSPSPVCSPFILRLSKARSYLSDAYSHASYACSRVSHPNTDDDMFLTAVSSGLEETEKNRPSLSEIQEINANESNDDPTFESPEFSFSQPNLQPSNRLQTPYRQRYQTQDGRAGSNQKILRRTAPARYTSHQQNVHETARLSGAGTISRQRHLPPNTVPSQRSSVTGWNWRSVDGYYLADDENGLRCDPGQFSHSMPGSLRGRQIEARLRALKEERNKKLLTRLWKQEQAIEDWKRKQILKAKEKMRKTEMKLDLERRTAQERAKKDIEKAQNKAEKRKLQEQNETAKKITSSYKAVEKISWVGKILWKLACF